MQTGQTGAMSLPDVMADSAADPLADLKAQIASAERRALRACEPLRSDYPVHFMLGKAIRGLAAQTAPIRCEITSSLVLGRALNQLQSTTSFLTTGHTLRE